MERLDIGVMPERPNIEAAIHFARYAIAKNLVKGKRVLDIACGEGYGSYLLKQAGAVHVTGVDVSKESVAKAENLFSGDGLEFKAADAASLDVLFAENDFDVVVSVETIEHLTDPKTFLENLKRLTKPEGVIILSCPNDHWYYPEDDQNNPYHQRKYRLDEFQKLSTEVLGSNVRWSVGTGVFGFGSTPLSSSETYSPVPGTWMSYMDVGASYLVNGGGELATSATQCSYFIGVWNAPYWTTGIAVFPLSMDDYAKMVVAQEKRDSDFDLHEALLSANAEQSRLQDELQLAQSDKRRLGLKWQASQAECEAIRETLFAANAEQSRLQDELQLAQSDKRRLGLKWQASQAECEAIRETLFAAKAEQSRLQDECETYRVGFHRYVRLRQILPAPVRSWIVKVVRLFRK